MINAYVDSSSHYVNVVENIVDSSTSIHNHVGGQILDTLSRHYNAQALCDSIEPCISSTVNSIIDTSSHVTNRISNYLTTNNYVDSAELDNRHYLTSDSTIITTMLYDINELKNGTTGNVTTANLCSSVESLCDNVALKDADNTFTGDNTFSGNTTFGGTDVTTTIEGTVTVPSGYTLGTTNTANCTDAAVNACDVYAVFDSIQQRMNKIQQRIDNIRDTLRDLRSARLPLFQSMPVVKSTRKLDVTANFTDGGATITDYKFCISTDAGMVGAICNDATTNNFVFTGLTPATQYYVQSYATNLKGTSASPISSVKTKAEMPTAGTMTLTPVDTAGFTVSIPDITTGGDPTVSVKVCYAKSDDCSGTLSYTCTDAENISAGSYSKTITHLDPNKQYCVKVEISNNGGDSTLTVGPDNVTVPSATPTFGTPALTVTDSTINISVPVANNGGADITAATICAYPNADYTGTAHCAPGVVYTASPIVGTITGLDPSKRYYWKVTVTNDDKTAVLKGDTTTLIGSPVIANSATASSTNTTVAVDGSLQKTGGASTDVKVCAFKNNDYSDTPKCSADTAMAAAGNFSRIITGLDENTQYYLLVIADNGTYKDTLKVNAKTMNVTLTLAPDSAGYFYTCGADTSITYTATLTGDDTHLSDYTYAWSINGRDTAATGSTLKIKYRNVAANYKVKCVATRNADFTFADSVTTKIATDKIPALVFCSDCEDGKIYIKSATNVDTATWLNASNVKVYDYKAENSYALPTGTYSVVATNNTSKCSVSYTGITIDRTPTSCAIAGLNSNESGTATKLDSVQDHEGNWYRVVEIGTGANKQCWLAENMRATTEPDSSTSIVQATASGYSYSNPMAYRYKDSTTYSDKYGLLYNFPAAMNINDRSTSFTYPHRGICPEGWHIPQDSEWSTLATAAGCSDAYGSGTGLGKLTAGCDWSTSSNTTAPGNYSYSEHNSSGFSALPAGRYNGSVFYDAGYNAYLWSSTPNDSNFAYRRYFNCDMECVSRTIYNRYNGFSVRCVRDNSGVKLSAVSKTDSTNSSLTISAAYTATKTITGATICAYTDSTCTSVAGTCATPASLSSSPLTGTITGLSANTQYYVKVTTTTADGTATKIAGPFKTANQRDTITFVANGGSGTMTKQVVDRGVATAIASNAFSHTNWEFLGWGTSNCSNDITYLNNANITTSGNDTLYAQWHTWCTGTPATNEGGSARIDSVKDHQDHWYKVVQIGEQCWLKENMRATTAPGSSTIIVQNPASGNSLTVPRAYRYNNSTTYSDKYGLLYNYPATMNLTNPTMPLTYPHQGICPKGWHVPQDSEWDSFATAAGCSAASGSGTGVGKLTGGCDWSPNSISTSPGNYSYSERNSSGFSALPAGYYNNGFDLVEGSAYFWTCSPVDTVASFSRTFVGTLEYVCRNLRSAHYYAFSVRCVRDNSGVTFGAITKTDSTNSSLTISAVYTATKTVTGATICAYTEATCTSVAGTCATPASLSSSPLTGTITGLSANTQYYVKVTTTTADGTASKIVGPFKTANQRDTITFVANGGSGTMTKQVVDRGVATAIKDNSYSHTGNWSFVNWNDDCNAKGVSYANKANITTNGNITLYAQWKTWCTGTPATNESGSARIDSVKDHQNNWYKVVQIGEQCWLKENMRCNTSPKGNITTGGNTGDSDYYVAQYYDYSAATQFTLRERGYLYNWCGAMDTTGTTYVHATFTNRRGICPAGWHVPTDAEWQLVEKAYLTDAGGSAISDASLNELEGRGKGIGKFVVGCYWANSVNSGTYANNYSYTDRSISGLSVLPVGFCIPNNGFYKGAGSNATYWSSTSHDDYTAYYRNFINSEEGIYRFNNTKYSAFSVRCVRDRALTVSATADTINLCGEESKTVTYTATLVGATASSYNWNVTGGTGSSTSNTITVTASADGTINVTCTAAGLTGTKSTKVTAGAPATMTICEDYAAPSVTISSTNCTTASLVWKNISNVTALTGNTILSSTTAPGVSNGHYTVTGVTSNNCSITKTVRLGASVIGCVGTPSANETASGGVITQVRDHQNNAYDVITIGNFCIMKQNLRVTTSPNPSHTLSNSGAQSTTESYYIQNDEFGNEGYLYNWRAAIDTTIDVTTIGANVDIPNRRGLCPQGWHLPTLSDWSSIMNCHDAGQLAAPNGSYTGRNWNSSTSANTPGNPSDPDKNVSGFSGIPVAYCNSGTFYDMGKTADYWTATSKNDTNAYERYLDCNSSSLVESNFHKHHGFSVRCVRN